MVNGILGKKIGMTQVFDDKGDVHPVTVLQAGPCVITQLKRNNPRSCTGSRRRWQSSGAAGRRRSGEQRQWPEGRRKGAG